jgi:RNA polymerase subunit RPABC4/transcription elongation factor Spt4
MKCEYCGEEAFLETPTGNIVICNRDKCKIAYCDDQCEDL